MHSQQMKQAQRSTASMVSLPRVKRALYVATMDEVLTYDTTTAHAQDGPLHGILLLILRLNQIRCCQGENKHDKLLSAPLGSWLQESVPLEPCIASASRRRFSQALGR